ncbi:unnamed protein product, partial [Timema podura]|nr:unnamed protein product [Timema podura]
MVGALTSRDITLTMASLRGSVSSGLLQILDSVTLMLVQSLHDDWSDFIEHDRVSGFWTWMFVLSKLPELGDTVFIVLRKQPLIFLHWYHHITVLLYSWFSYTEYTASARWFIVMNYFVHSVMYSYYALRSMGYSLPRGFAMLITTCQLAQMVTGCAINIWAHQYLQIGQKECHISQINIKLSIAMVILKLQNAVEKGWAESTCRELRSWRRPRKGLDSGALSLVADERWRWQSGGVRAPGALWALGLAVRVVSRCRALVLTWIASSAWARTCAPPLVRTSIGSVNESKQLQVPPWIGGRHESPVPGLSVNADLFSELKAAIRWIGVRTRCLTAPAQHHTLVTKWAGPYE